LSLDLNGRGADTVPMASSPTSLHLLPAEPVDAGTVARLAALDETAPLAAPVLLAVSDGRAVAALSVSDGRVAADPFARTGEAVELLRLRARQAGGSGAPRRLRLGRFGLAA